MRAKLHHIYDSKDLLVVSSCSQSLKRFADKLAPAMVSLPLMLTVLMLLHVFFLLGCTSRPDPPPWKAVIRESNEQTSSQPPPKTSNHLVVYLDTSASMTGYVSVDQQGKTVFSRSLQELRNFVTIINPPIDVVVRRVESTISAPHPDTYLSEASINPGLFTGKETDLAGAISLFDKGPEILKASASAGEKSGGEEAGVDESGEEAPPPARFHLLVTDGVQSRTQQSTDASCIAGSDQVCVRKRILALLNKGWGAYVIGMRSEFQGKIFSEVKRGTIINYESKKRDPESLRPFYIYIFSPDRTALDKLVEVLIERLRPLIAHAGGMRTLALTSAYTNGSAQAELIVPKDSGHGLSLSKPGGYQNPTGFTLRVDVSTDKRGPLPFQIITTPPWSATVRDEGTPKELADMLSWNLVQLNPEVEENKKERERYPEIKITNQKTEPDGKTTLDATAQFPGGRTGTPQWRVYLLEARLNLQQQTPPWIRQWSTELDTTAESANKTLYLESALLGLWRNPELEKQSIAKIYIRVGP